VDGGVSEEQVGVGSQMQVMGELGPLAVGKLVHEAQLARAGDAQQGGLSKGAEGARLAALER
jgi:hypothetical protein